MRFASRGCIALLCLRLLRARARFLRPAPPYEADALRARWPMDGAPASLRLRALVLDTRRASPLSRNAGRRAGVVFGC